MWDAPPDTNLLTTKGKLGAFVRGTISPGIRLFISGYHTRSSATNKNALITFIGQHTLALLL